MIGTSLSHYRITAKLGKGGPHIVILRELSNERDRRIRQPLAFPGLQAAISPHCRILRPVED